MTNFTDPMLDTPNPQHKPFTFSGLLLSSLMTGSLICGVIGGLAVLFLADGLFDVGPDPAIPAAEMKQRLEQADKRIRDLEKATHTQRGQVFQPAPDSAEIARLQNNVEQNTQQTQQLEQKVQNLSATNQNENKAAQIALGLTQIKTAYENDLPLATGIQTLKGAVTSETLQKTLNDLAVTTERNFPSKKELLADIGQMKASLAPAAVTDPRGLTWDERAKLQLNKFVSVQPQQVTAQKTLLSQVEQSVRNNEFTAALATLQKLPETAQQKVFYKKIEMRAQAENMVDTVVNDITQKISGITGNGGGGQGSLY